MIGTRSQNEKLGDLGFTDQEVGGLRSQEKHGGKLKTYPLTSIGADIRKDRQRLEEAKKGGDLDGDGKVEKDEKELVSAKVAVNAANTKRLNLNISPDNPDLRDAHGHYLSKSEDLAEAVAEYKDNRDKTRLSSSEKKAVSSAAGVSSSDKRPSTARKGGRGKVRY